MDDDFAAFAQARYPALLRAAALLLGRERDHAEDLVQETLAKVCVRWRAGGIDTPEAFTRKVMVNLTISRGRREALRRAFLRTQPPPDVAVEMEAGGSVSAVWRTVEALPPRQRAVIVLRFYEDLPFDEIANALGISPSTARSQCLRAKETLRQALKNESEVQR